MRKQCMKWAVSAVLLPAAMGLVACSESGGDAESGNGGGGVGKYTVESSKQKLEDAATELMDNLSASNFQEVTDLAKYIRDTYGDYDASAVDNWYKGCLDDITTVLSHTSVGNSTSNTYKRIYQAGIFTGHFTAQNDRWTYTAANDLQFIVKDQKGQLCVLKLVTSGATVRIYVGDETEYKGTYNGYTYTSTSEKYENYVDVPQNIVVTATQGAKELASVTVTTSLTVSGEKPSPVTDKFDVTVSTKLSSGYAVDVKRAFFNGGADAGLEFVAKKNDKTLVSANVKGKTRFTSNGDGDYELQSGSVDNLEVDILGKVQVKGTCSDVKGVIEDMENADDNDRDEAAYKRYIANVNARVNLGLYFDKTSTKQATLRLEPFYKERQDYYNGGVYLKWGSNAILEFADGTSYGVEEYFNEDRFGDVVKRFEQLLRDFEDMVK